ncbi:MAG TPA: site-2 protease family protein [Acidimicrobiia bacterium]|nr:site-2 protease family protein [Acidimicrobiia bacterium]
MLRFRLLGMPVTVRSSFVIVAALIGFLGVGSIEQTIAWIVIVFVSILIHELGHAFTARRYGSNVAIELNGLGGLTRWAVAEDELTPGRRALIAAAGSAVGLTFGGLVWLVASRFGPYEPLAAFILENTIYVNVFWGLLNWLPIRPLDGGHLLESLLEKIAPARADSIARVVFIVTAAGALALAIRFRLIFIAVLAGWLLLSEFTAGRTPQQTTGQSTGLPTLSYDDPPVPEKRADEPDRPEPEETPDAPSH